MKSNMEIDDFGILKWFLIIIATVIIFFIIIFIINSFLNMICDKRNPYEKDRSTDGYRHNNKSQIQSKTTSYDYDIEPIKKEKVEEIETVKEEQLEVVETIQESTIPNAIIQKNTPISKTIYFPLNNGKLFLKKYTECKFQCVFEAREVDKGVFHYTIISIGKVKSWDISDAVVNVGSIMQEDAHGFKTIKEGVALQKEDSGTIYWEIAEPTHVEFQK